MASRSKNDLGAIRLLSLAGERPRGLSVRTDHPTSRAPLSQRLANWLPQAKKTWSPTSSTSHSECAEKPPAVTLSLAICAVTTGESLEALTLNVCAAESPFDMRTSFTIHVSPAGTVATEPENVSFDLKRTRGDERIGTSVPSSSYKRLSTRSFEQFVGSMAN